MKDPETQKVVSFIKENSKCVKCMGESFNGEGNHFHGKTHSKESKEKISKSRKGKATGDKNSMANLVWRKKAYSDNRQNFILPFCNL